MTATLHMLCGKICAGKSSLAARLAEAPLTVIVSEDQWLARLFGEEMASVEDYLRFAAKLRTAMAPHLTALLEAGMSVVLDYPANTPANRAWMKGIAEAARAVHRLHWLDVPDDVCRARLRARNAAGDHEFAATDAQFDQITAYFVPPSGAEGLEIVIHRL
ncbi:MAG TPA: ATP-binding protein [Allosphingosinicella sp.]|nr:ATP-binding protein [Allosphingosinicella sp.]